MGVPFAEERDEESPINNDASSSDESDEETDENDSAADDDDDPTELYLFSSDSDDEWDDPSEGCVLTLVYRAAELGDDVDLQLLLPSLSVSIDTRGPDGDCALHLTALYGHLACANVLIEAGAKADLADEEGAVPLHDAAAGGYTELVELLLTSAPRCIDTADSDGDTPLHNAARGGFLDVIKILLERGANPTISNNDFLTAAALSAQASEARQLLEAAEAAFEAPVESITASVAAVALTDDV